MCEVGLVAEGAAAGRVLGSPAHPRSETFKCILGREPVEAVGEGVFAEVLVPSVGFRPDALAAVEGHEAVEAGLEVDGGFGEGDGLR